MIKENCKPTGSPDRFIPYPVAMRLLSNNLAEEPTTAELAAWVFLGPERGGIAAYLNANELDPPPRFHYDLESDDYIAPLMACWFRREEVQGYKASLRYVTWSALVERWEKLLQGRVESFVLAKIAESRLLDLHPITGLTRGSFPHNRSLPPIESALFDLSQVQAIEVEDFGCGPQAEATDTAPEKQGVPAKSISEHFTFWDEERWRELLSKPPSWLVDARIGPVVRRQRTLWSPAVVVVCLEEYREKYWHSENEALKRHARDVPISKQLRRTIQVHFPDWVDDMELYQA